MVKASVLIQLNRWSDPRKLEPCVQHFCFFGCGFVHAHSLIAKRFQYVLFLAAKLMYPRQHVEFYDSVKTKRTRLAVWGLFCVTANELQWSESYWVSHSIAFEDDGIEFFGPSASLQDPWKEDSNTTRAKIYIEILRRLLNKCTDI